MKFQMDIRLAVEPEVSDVQTDINSTLNKIKGRMTQNDLKVIIGAANSNWTEGSPSDAGKFLLLSVFKFLNLKHTTKF